MNTVTKCEHMKFWEKDGKKVPIYLVTLSDGRDGQSFSKEIPVGTKEDEIEITDGQYGLKFKYIVWICGYLIIPRPGAVRKTTHLVFYYHSCQRTH